MARKANQAAKKDNTATETKTEGGIAPRRSGRAVTKIEPPVVSPSKDASRSRRSSTAAQTAASVADSKTTRTRGSTSSHKESTPPSEPASRVKAVRRSSGRINYEESDNEEEAAPAKLDENFESGEEFEESESDEKSKPKAKGRQPRSSARTKSPKKGKAKPKARGRKGRSGARKKVQDKDSEEEEVFDVGDVSDKEDEPEVKETPPPVKAGRGRKRHSAATEEKKPPATKGSRRSARATSKEESPKKRPTRGSSKRYAEDDNEIEEITGDKEDEAKEEHDSQNQERKTSIDGEDSRKVEGEAVPEEDSRKRKREESPVEANKRLKEEDKADEIKDIEEEKEEEKPGLPEEEPIEEKTEDVEKMEIDESNSVQTGDSIAEARIEGYDEIKDGSEDADIPITEKEVEEKAEPIAADIPEAPKVEESEDSSSDIMEVNESEITPEEPVQDTLQPDVETKVIEDIPPVQEIDTKHESTVSPPSEDNEEPEVVHFAVPQQNEETAEISKEEECLHASESTQNDISVEEADKGNEAAATPDDAIEIVQHPTPAPTNDQTADVSFNGAEKTAQVANPIPVIISTPVATSIESDSLKANGEHNNVIHSAPPSNQIFPLPGRKYVVNPKVSENVRHSVKDRTFGFASLNLGTDLCLQKEKLLNELNSLNAHILCLQQVQKPFYTAVLEPSLDALGYKSVFSQPEDSLRGMATFYKSSLFRLSGQSEVSLRKLIDKELESSSLDVGLKSAVRSHVKKCGNVLFTHFSTVIGTHAVTIANVQIPPNDLSIHALQVSCLAQEVVRVNSGTNKPFLLGGEFNIAENDASYQLLRDGYLSNEMIEELQKRRDVSMPEKENVSLVNLLWKSFQHPSSNFGSCYTSVLGREFSIPERKTTAPDLLWYSNDNMNVVGVLDAMSTGDHRFSLKADVAFTV